MSDDAIDPDEFREKWFNYLDQLDRLRLSVPDQQSADELDEAKETLENVVRKTALNAEENDD